MSPQKHLTENLFSPQYVIISKSEPKYELIKKQLLDPSRSSRGYSSYFIRAENNKGCICRIRAGNGTALFYEIMNHSHNGITDEDIQEALRNPENACSLPGYYHITPKIREKLQKIQLMEAACIPVRHTEANHA